MRRSVEEVEVLFVYEILPPELWPGILAYLSMFQRYRFRTVCKAWGELRGLIDQSVTSLKKKALTPIDLHRMCCLTQLNTSYTPLLSDAIRDGKLKSVCDADFTRYDHLIGDTTMIAKLSNLTKLKVSGRWSDYVDVLPRLSLLRSLEVENMCYTGPFYDKFDTLKHLTGLTELWVSNMSIDEAELFELKELRHLDLYDTDVSANGIAVMTMLESLTLYDEKMCRPGVLRHLTRLTALNISGIDYVGDDEIKHLTALRSLDVSDNSRVTSDVLLNFRHLTRLLLSDDPSGVNGMNDTRLSLNLAQMTGLRELKVNLNDDCVVRDETLACLTGLTNLHITSPQESITAASLSLLVNLTQLEISDLDIATLDVSLLPVSLRSLVFTDSVGCPIMLPIMLTRLVNLTDLTVDLYPTYHSTDEFLEKIAHHKSLERIYYTSRSSSAIVNVYAGYVPEHIQLINMPW